VTGPPASLAAVLAACVALAGGAVAQEPATDWAKEVDRACTSPRYGLRLAAARKVAAAGDAPVPAIRAFAAQRGKDAIPAALVEAIADANAAGGEVTALLREWAADGDFFWRGQAMKGLALRARAQADGGAALFAVFDAHRNDPAWLARTFARFGHRLLRPESALAFDDDDPRAATKLAALLLQHGQPVALQPLFDALADGRTFLGDPWGQRRAREALAALRAWLGDAHGYREDGSFADNRASIAALLAAARAKSGQALAMPEALADADPPPAGGIEILSCKHGDLFLAWTADGEVRTGLAGGETLRLDPERWAALSRRRTALQLAPVVGVVICDSMRLRFDEPELHARVAPRALPEPAANWLKQLAAAFEEAQRPGLAGALRTRLAQFVAR
jgi:hypothetical protein